MTLDIRRAGAVTIVEIARPERANAIDAATADALAAVLDVANDDDTIGAVVLTARGARVFCAGIDFGNPDGLDREAAWERRHYAFDTTIATLARFERPLIAAINGAAVGSGWMAAMFADQIVAVSHASFGLPEIDIGVPSPVAAVLLESFLPARGAADFVLSGRRIGAAEAQALGLIQAVVEPEALLDAAIERAEACAKKPTISYRLNKRFRNQRRQAALAEANAALKSFLPLLPPR